MRRTIEFSFDLSTTFLWAVVAVLVFLGGAREHIFGTLGVNFYILLNFSPDLGSKRRTYKNNEQTVKSQKGPTALQSGTPARLEESLTYGFSL